MPSGEPASEHLLHVAEGVHGSGESETVRRRDTRRKPRGCEQNPTGERSAQASSRRSDGGSACAQKKSLLKLPKEHKQYQRMSAQQKEEVIKLVERSQLPVNQTLRKLRVPTRTYYRWLQRGSLEDDRPIARRIWNRLLRWPPESVFESFSSGSVTAQF